MPISRFSRYRLCMYVLLASYINQAPRHTVQDSPTRPVRLVRLFSLLSLPPEARTPIVVLPTTPLLRRCHLIQRDQSGRHARWARLRVNITRIPTHLFLILVPSLTPADSLHFHLIDHTSKSRRMGLMLHTHTFKLWPLPG